MTPFSLLTLLLLLTTTSLSLSSATYTYTFLNVSSSLHSTLSLFSTSSQSQAQQQTLGLNQHHSLTLQLHPRASLHPPSSFHTNYKSLTHSRIARDNARAVSLYSKAALALRGLTHADLSTPQYVTDQYQQSELQAPVTSGTSQGSGEYFSRVGVGSPTKDYYLVIDTGSDVSWIQCEPCTDCYQQSDPIYNPSSSSSYSPISCSSRQCSSLEVSACRRETCLYQVSYGDGSYTVGDFVFETLSFTGSSTAGAGAATGGSIPRIALGCGHDNQGLFVGAAGLLGLGGGPLSLTSQLRASSFSYCLVDRDSSRSSTLEFNSEAPLSSSVVTAPLLRNDKLNTFYYIGLEGISVGGQQVAIPPALFSMDESGAGGVIVDSGTAITRLPSQAYNSLRNAFTRLSQHLRPASGVALFDTCYDFSRVSSVRVPTVAMHFSGGHSLNLPAKNYLIPVDSAGTFCFAFAETTSSMSIIGNVQQQGTRVHFDLQSNEVSFSLNNC